MIFGSQPGDPRVKKVLDILELQYLIDNDGDFEVIMAIDDERSQIAFIDSETETLGSFEIREIWSVAYISEGFLDIDTANTLLLHNAEMKIGSWRLLSAGDNTFYATFCVQVAADCSPEAFLQALLVVLQTADEMEEKLTGDDEL